MKNLQIAREKRNMRRERMKKIASLRRASRLKYLEKMKANEKSTSSTDDFSTTAPPTKYDVSKDYFLSDRKESELDKVLISLRLSKHVHDKKTTLKHPSSIRNATNFPLLNSIQHVDILVNNNPVFWDTEATLLFIKQFITIKSVINKLQEQDIDGETILNLTKKDLTDYLKFDDNSAEILSTKFEQLKKETILRYVNS